MAGACGNISPPTVAKGSGDRILILVRLLSLSFSIGTFSLWYNITYIPSGSSPCGQPLTDHPELCFAI